MVSSLSSVVTCATVLLLLGIEKISARSQTGDHKYEITTSWNNHTIPANETVTIKFKSVDGSLGIDIKAPFYNDTMPNEDPGRVDHLGSFEVVEVFLMGDNVHYLELEFGPGGHYLVYYLVGLRTVENATLLLDEYNVSINETERTWEGHAVVPVSYLPPALESFNAYGIHGPNDSRVHIALFPVDQESDAQNPDFHRLDAFKPIDLSDLVCIRNSTAGKDNAASPLMIARTVLYFFLAYCVATFVF